MFKKLERVVKGLVQDNPSVAAPDEYVKRFITCMREVYQSM